MDVLQNLRSAGNGSVSIEGGLVNHGIIQNDHYGFHVSLSGDLSCNGVIRVPMVELDETTVHHLTMGPEGDLDTSVLLPEFVPGTIVVDSPVRISGGIGLGIGGMMILSPDVSVHLADSGSLSGGTVLAGGNPILMDGTGVLSSITSTTPSSRAPSRSPPTVRSPAASSSKAAPELALHLPCNQRGRSTPQHGTHPEWPHASHDPRARRRRE